MDTRKVTHSSTVCNHDVYTATSTADAAPIRLAQFSPSLSFTTDSPYSNKAMEPKVMSIHAVAIPWKSALLLGMLAYLILVYLFRFQRAKRLQKRYAPAGRESFRSMTADDAQAIIKTLAELEFPSLYGFSMLMSLFRVRSAWKNLSYLLLAEQDV